MGYNRRDLIGHYIEKRQKAQEPCGHACCRGYRVHPANYPVILPNKLLRSASEDDLRDHFLKVSEQEGAKARKAEAQILHEMDRRDRETEQRAERAERAATRKEAIAANRAAQRQEREVEYERIKLEAEAETQGYLVNAKGMARGISDAEILTGREDVFRRYATDEARDYFASHPRPTASYFRGHDTRIVERATERRKKRRGVVERGPRGGRTGGRTGGRAVRA